MSGQTNNTTSAEVTDERAEVSLVDEEGRAEDGRRWHTSAGRIG
jgi:hypothetical protein